MHLARRFPDGSSDLPGSSDRRPSGASLFGLAPCGVYRAPDIAARAVRSYRTFSPLPLPGGRGGLFSVALSFRLPGLGVTQRTAFWSSDFPPAPGGAGDRLNDSNRREFYRPGRPASPRLCASSPGSVPRLRAARSRCPPQAASRRSTNRRSFAVRESASRPDSPGSEERLAACGKSRHMTDWCRSEVVLGLRPWPWESAR